MIDLHLLREDTDTITQLLHKKDPSFDVDKLVQLDAQVRALKTEIDLLRARKNGLAKLNNQGADEQLRAQGRELAAQLKYKEHELEEVQAVFNHLYLRCPNSIMPDVPSGGKESNKVIKIVGEKPVFTFTPKNHVELGALNGWFDFEAASRMSGAHFALYTGQAVRVVYALMMYMLNNNMRHGFSPVLPPYLVNEKALEGGGNFPRFKDEAYKIVDQDLYLIPTAEVNLTNMYRDHIFMADQLPVHMTAWTSCFRREAGGYGAHERGLIRIHQFEKVELYTVCKPEDAAVEQERMVACAETILQDLGLHYRISLLAAQDSSFASAKTYDIEVWMPGQGEYKEVSSASNCTDFQARRCEIRYKTEQNAKPKLVYTLNASSLALPRLLVALMETYQQPDGSILLPDCLKSVTVAL